MAIDEHRIKEILGDNNANNSYDSSVIAGNKDGSVLERLEDITQELSGTTGIATFPAAAAPANNVSLAEIIRAIYNHNLLGSLNTASINHFTVTADMTSATWNTVASHEIATVTGAVRMVVLPQCTGTLVDAADGASIQLGIEGETNAIIGSTGAAGAGGNTIETNEWWVDTSPADKVIQQSKIDALTFIVGGGLDVGYEITGAALTGGTLIFHVWWEPLDATGAVAASAGGSL